MKTTLKYFVLLLLCFFSAGTMQAQSQHWQCDPYVWEYDMTAYVTLTLNNKAVNNLTDYEIAAFCGSECRGVATIQTSEKGENVTTYSYLRIRSNQQSGETITFKAYNKVFDKEYIVEGYSLTFQYQGVIGLPSSLIQFPILDDCTISVVSSDETKGTVEGGIIVKFGVEVNVNATAKEGYHFVNWTSEDNVMSTASSYTFSAEEDISLVANFAPNQYMMTFVLDNGEENVVRTLDYGCELVAPPDLQKTGFTFKGWNPVVPATVPSADQTFTAQWERNSYKLTWDVDGVKTEDTLAYEAAITRPESPAKDGYTFAGWIPDVIETMPAEDVTYTATWSLTKYTLNYDLAGGSLADGETNPSFYTIESDALTLVNPIREGYTFSGWTGTGLTGATQTVNIAAGSIGNCSYTATWTVNQYTMTFVLDNGEENVVKTQDYGSKLTAPEHPVKIGFTFIGWSPEVPSTVPASDMTFEAVYEQAYTEVVKSEDTNIGIETDGSATVVNGDKSISTVSIPESVTSSDGTQHPVTGIAEGAFADCTNLKSIYVYLKEPIDLTNDGISGISVFEGVDKSTCVLYVPYGCLDKYREAPVWGDFVHIVEMEPVSVDGLRAASIKHEEWYDVYGRKLNIQSVRKGLYIHNGRKVFKLR